MCRPMLSCFLYNHVGCFFLVFYFCPPVEDRQKKKRQQKEKRSAEGKTSLQRSKTFVNLLFKKDRKEKSRSKSPSHHVDKGEGIVTGQFFFPGIYSASHKAKCSLRS